MGYASAMAWILFIIILIFTLLLLKVSDRFTYYAG
jgi:multiple sugar transport system permease protein